jgi:hypothetical protein
MTFIRKEPRARDGWNNGDKDVAFQLFRGVVWDGDLASKSSRDHLVEHGYAERFPNGMQTLTRKGRTAFLTSPVIWLSAYRRWRLWGRNPFVARKSSGAK